MFSRAEKVELQVANATTRDARAGWDLFYTSGGTVTMEEINATLESAGYNPIHQRTYTHYGNLLVAGYNRYLSINRFDIARSNDPYEQVNSSSLYSFRDSELGIIAVFAKSSRLIEAAGQAKTVGDVGAMLHFPDREVSDGLRSIRPTVGDMITIRFLEAQHTITARVVDRDLISDSVSIEVEYTRLISIASIAPALARELDNVNRQFALVADDANVTLDVMGRRIASLFELIEGARSLVNAAGSSQSDPVYAAPPVLESLTFASPVAADLKLATEAYEVIRHLGVVPYLSLLISAVIIRKNWYEGSVKKTEAELNREKLKKKVQKPKHQAPDAKGPPPLAMSDSEAQDVLAAERALSAGTASLETDGLAVVRRLFPDSTMTDDEIRRHIRRHIIPVLSALAETGVTDIDLSDEVQPDS